MATKLLFTRLNGPFADNRQQTESKLRALHGRKQAKTAVSAFLGSRQYVVATIWTYDAAKKAVLTDRKPQIHTALYTNARRVNICSVHISSFGWAKLYFHKNEHIREWIPFSLDSFLCCEDVIKSKLSYGLMMRPKQAWNSCQCLQISHTKPFIIVSLQNSRIFELS